MPCRLIKGGSSQKGLNDGRAVAHGTMTKNEEEGLYSAERCITQLPGVYKPVCLQYGARLHEDVILRAGSS